MTGGSRDVGDGGARPGRVGDAGTEDAWIAVAEEDDADPAWIPGPGQDAAPPRDPRLPAGWEAAPGAAVYRPSLLAGLDVLGKVAFVVVLFFFPVLVSLLFQGQLAHMMVAAVAAAGLQGINLLVVGVLAFGPMVQLAFTRYLVDDEGIRVRTQLLSRTERRVEWEKVTALLHRRTVTDRILGIERLDVVAYGARGTTLNLVGLRMAGPLRDEVARRMRASASVESLFRGD